MTLTIRVVGVIAAFVSINRRVAAFLAFAYAKHRRSLLVLQLDDVTRRNLKQRGMGQTGDNILSLSRFIADCFT
jgi:hypothetical protein